MADDGREGRGGRWGLFVLAFFVGLPLLALCGLTILGPPSPETMVFTLAVTAMVVGGLMAPWSPRLAWGARLGFVVLFLVVVYRVFAADAGRTVRAHTGPAMTGGRLLDRIVPERDVAIGGTLLLTALGEMGPREPGLLDALRDGYGRMRRDQGPVPSSTVSTFVLGQTPEDHTVFRIAPADRFNPPEAVVVFLHGSVGNITIACWQVAQAANPVGVDVVCPSMNWTAHWEEPDGLAILNATLARLRAENVRRIYLAGLSQGAIGISRMRSVDVDGVVLISGVSARAVPKRVPTLVLHGRNDPRTPVAPARRYARAVRATYHEHPEAGHWLLLSEHAWLTDHLRRWLAAREGLAALHGEEAAEPASGDR